MKYFITGCTSGTGNAVIKEMIKTIDPAQIGCLVRATSREGISFLKESGVVIFEGDVLNPDTYKKVLNKDITYIDITHPKHYHISLEAIKKIGIERAFFVTTTGIFSSYNQFSEIYKINEEKIKNSGITYTILRPSMIYGHLRDRNMSRLIRFLNSYPIFPLFGEGKSLMQPVFVDDLASGIVSAIISSKSENQAYNICGLREISYRNLILTIVEILEKNVHLLNIPLGLAKLGAEVGSLIPRFPITVEQVLRLQENKAFDISKAQIELNYIPREFNAGIAIEVELMRNQGLI